LLQDNLRGIEVKQIASGHSFVVVVTAKGELLSWGANKEGQLGIGVGKEQYVWMFVLLFAAFVVFIGIICDICGIS
jgi:alpha-tubulin suppressor-like RCC1 family protein